MTKGPAVLCVGQLVADVVVRPVDRLPGRGEAMLVADLQWVSGGCAANTAAVLAKLGADARIAGLVGTDPQGDMVLADVQRCGVNVSGVSRSKTVPTSAVVVLVDSQGERSFFYRAGGSEALSLEIVLEPLRRGVQFVHVGGTMKLLNLDLVRFLEEAKSRGCTTSLDTDWDVSGQWMKRLGPILSRVDLLLTNREEAHELTGLADVGSMARSLLERGPRIVVIKCGADGAVLAKADAVRTFPPYDVKVLDTTCAGDAFVGGFLYALTRGWSEERAVEVGNAAGALATTEVSHRGVRSLEAVMQLVKKGSAR